MNQTYKISAIFLTLLSGFCIDSTLTRVDAKPSAGVYVAGRDLAGNAAIGTHQFLVLVPQDPSKFKTQDLGDGTQGIVIGAHNRTRLLAEFFEPADLQAIKEYSNPDKYVSYFRADFDTEVHPVDIGRYGTDAAIQKILDSVKHYTSFENRYNHPYPSNTETLLNGPTLLNSNSWAQSVVEHNFGAGKVVEDFVGKDSGHQNRFPASYFK